jgi:hypothetical protein
LKHGKICSIIFDICCQLMMTGPKIENAICIDQIGRGSQALHPPIQLPTFPLPHNHFRLKNHPK